MINRNEILDKIIEMVVKVDDEVSEYREDYYSMLSDHYDYKTMETYIEDGEVKGFVVYNISESGRVVNVVDMFIDGSVKKGVKVIRYFLFGTWCKWPTLEYCRFERVRKYNDRSLRSYKMDRIMNVIGEKNYGKHI